MILSQYEGATENCSKNWCWLILVFTNSFHKFLSSLFSFSFGSSFICSPEHYTPSTLLDNLSSEIVKWEQVFRHQHDDLTFRTNRPRYCLVRVETTRQFNIIDFTDTQTAYCMLFFSIKGKWLTVIYFLGEAQRVSSCPLWVERDKQPNRRQVSLSRGNLSNSS